MGLTNLPNGLSSMGSPVTGGTYVTTGNIYFVNSVIGSNDNTGKDPDHPVATIGKGVSLCTSGQGDTVFVMPKHAETITGSTATVRVSGVSIIGLGEGDDRPTVTLGTSTTARFATSGAHSTYIENLLFKVAVDACATPIFIESSECSIVNCEGESGAGTEPTDFIRLTSDADYGIIDGFKYYHYTSPAGTEPTSIINIGTTAAGALNGVEIKNCEIVAHTSLGLIQLTSMVFKSWIHGNVLFKASTDNICINGTSEIQMTIVNDNKFLGSSSDSGEWMSGGCSTASSLWSFNNPGCHLGQQGALLGTPKALSAT